MKKLLLSLSVFSLLLGSYATTLAVDGSSYSTISDALAALNRSDGEADVLDISMDTISHSDTLAVDFTGTTDALTINGDSNSDGNCVLVFSGGTEYAMVVTQTSGVNFTMNDVTIIPEDNAAEDAQTVAVAALQLKDDEAALVGNRATFNNVVISGSTSGNAVVDPTAEPPADITQFDGSAAPMYCSGLRVQSTVDGTSDYQVAVNDSFFSHGASRGVYARSDAGSTATFTNCKAYYNGNVGIRTYDMGGDLTLNNCEACYNGGGGFEMNGTKDGSFAAGDITILDGKYSNNTGNGIWTQQDAMISVKGSVGTYLEIIGNSNRGLKIGADGDGAINSTFDFENLIITDNGAYGVEFYELDFAAAANQPVENCLMAYNGFANVRIGDTNESAATLSIKNSTMYRPIGSSDSFNAPFGNIMISYTGCDLLTVDCQDCIIAGSGTYAYRNGRLDDGSAGLGGEDCVINFTNCGLPNDGRHALDAVSFDSTGATTTINQTSVVTANPQFVSVVSNPLDPEFSFNIVNTNTDYQGAASDSSDLTGWGTMVDAPTSASSWALYK